MHYAHISVGMFFIGFYVFYSFIFQATFFETAYQKSHPLGKSGSFCDVVQLVEKISYLLYFQFLSQKINNIRIIILYYSRIYGEKRYWLFIKSSSSPD